MTEQAIKNLKHVFFEIGGELLSKPNALSQIIEGRGEVALVFCNTPSDTDLVEVLLKKRGVAARKLIGNVPAQKLEKTLSQLKGGEISTIVVTDIAARGIDIDDFDIVINYTAPTDADTYLHRINRAEEFKHLKTVATLVAPLDITNFHYVKKAVETEFTKEELPDAQTIFNAKLERLSGVASSKNVLADAKYASFVEGINKHSNKDAIIAYLLCNTLEVMPALQVAAEREEEPMDDDFDRQDDGRGNRNRRMGGGRNDQRGGRDNRDRDDDRGGNKGGRRPYADLDDEAAMQAEEAQNRRKPRPSLPPLREARIYFGQGKDQGMTEASLRSLVQEQGGLTSEDVKRVILRKGYAFFDVLEEQSTNILEKLSTIDSSDGSKVCVKKATVISTQRQEPASEEAGEIDSGSSSAIEEQAVEVA